MPRTDIPEHHSGTPWPGDLNENGATQASYSGDLGFEPEQMMDAGSFSSFLFGEVSDFCRWKRADVISKLESI